MYDQIPTVIKTDYNSDYCSLTMRLWDRLYLEGMAKATGTKEGGNECEKTEQSRNYTRIPVSF
jgi:hypothetical protein